jgi:hypothetical protein
VLDNDLSHGLLDDAGEAAYTDLIARIRAAIDRAAPAASEVQS